MNTITKTQAIGLVLILCGAAAAAAFHPVSNDRASAGAVGDAGAYSRIHHVAERVRGPHVEDVIREARRSVCVRHAIASGVAAEGPGALLDYEGTKSGSRARLNDGLPVIR